MGTDSVPGGRRRQLAAGEAPLFSSPPCQLPGAPGSERPWGSSRPGPSRPCSSGYQLPSVFLAIFSTVGKAGHRTLAEVEQAITGMAGQRPTLSTRGKEQWTRCILGARGVGRVECASHTRGVPPKWGARPHHLHGCAGNQPVRWLPSGGSSLRLMRAGQEARGRPNAGSDAARGTLLTDISEGTSCTPPAAPAPQGS